MKLLDAGFDVRGTVRRLDRAGEVLAASRSRTWPIATASHLVARGLV